MEWLPGESPLWKSTLSTASTRRESFGQQLRKPPRDINSTVPVSNLQFRRKLLKRLATCPARGCVLLHGFHLRDNSQLREFALAFTDGLEQGYPFSTDRNPIRGILDV